MFHPIKHFKTISRHRWLVMHLPQQLQKARLLKIWN